MRRSAPRCDTIIDLIDHCLAEHEALASSSRPDQRRSPHRQPLPRPSHHVANP
jgi:hypothetical protein